MNYLYRNINFEYILELIFFVRFGWRCWKSEPIQKRQSARWSEMSKCKILKVQQICTFIALFELSSIIVKFKCSRLFACLGLSFLHFQIVSFLHCPFLQVVKTLRREDHKFTAFFVCRYLISWCEMLKKEMFFFSA